MRHLSRAFAVAAVLLLGGLPYGQRALMAQSPTAQTPTSQSATAQSPTAKSPTSQDKSLATPAETAPGLLQVGDVTIITDSEKHTKEAQALLKQIASLPPDQRNRSQEFDRIRGIRARLSKRSLELRALLESFHQYRSSLSVQLTHKRLQRAKAPLFSEAEIKQSEQTADKLTREIAQQETLAASANSNDRSAIQQEIDRLQQQLQARESTIARWKTRQKLAQEAAAASEKDIKKLEDSLSKVDGVIGNGQVVLRQLDEALFNLDGTTDSLLQTDILNINYTDRSTYIFAVLVGAVIVGFFAIAFYSEEARRAIFAGESGIQFVTLFSLVIAIILFGVLKILEGKELAALLGGLSGYILGRGNPGSAHPQQAAPPPSPQPAPPAG